MILLDIRKIPFRKQDSDLEKSIRPFRYRTGCHAGDASGMGKTLLIIGVHVEELRFGGYQ